MKRLSVLLALLTLTATSVFAQPGTRALPDNTLATPVFIEIGSKTESHFKTSGTGSGFYLRVKEDIYLVTAKHVLIDKKTKKRRGETLRATSFSRDLTSDSTNVLYVDLEGLRIHPTHDVAVIAIAVLSGDQMKMTDNITPIKEAPLGITGLDTTHILPMDSVLVANDVFIFGYPTSIGLRHIPQIDYTRPLLRKGIVAGINKKARTIILDCPLYPGNSGGPVFQIERTSFKTHIKLIGVVTEFVPFAEELLESRYGQSFLGISNSGYSVVEPMDHVLELVNDK